MKLNKKVVRGSNEIVKERKSCNIKTVSIKEIIESIENNMKKKQEKEQVKTEKCVSVKRI